MKKFLAIIMTICVLASVFCIATIPATAAGGLSVIVCGMGYDGITWGLSIHDDFEKAWNEAIYYSTHLEEAWNGAVRYESEYDRPAIEGFEYITLDFYDDWNADSNGDFGSGIGFKDGEIYVPDGAKIKINLGGHTINRGVTGNAVKENAMYIDAGADISILNGTIIGNVHSDKNAKVRIHNVYVTDNAENGNVSARSASVLGEGSFAMIISILTLVASIVSICLTVAFNKKKAVPAAANGTSESDDEE